MIFTGELIRLYQRQYKRPAATHYTTPHNTIPLHVSYYDNRLHHYHMIIIIRDEPLIDMGGLIRWETNQMVYMVSVYHHHG